MSPHHDWPEPDPPVRLRYRLLLFGGMLAFALLIVATGEWR